MKSLIISVVVIGILMFFHEENISKLDISKIYDQRNEYLVESLVSPRMAGYSLKIFGMIMNWPILGPLIGKISIKLNNS
jgi:hypothetical protein